MTHHHAENDDPWSRDAAMLFGIAVSARRRGVERHNLLEASLFTALAIERLMKAALRRVNPLFVYEKQDFANAVPIHYKSRVVPSPTRPEVLSPNPNGDVVAMRTAAHRARVISKVTSERFGMIMHINHVRDLICHCDLDGLKDESLRRIAHEDGPLLAMEFAGELGLDRWSLLQDVEAASEARRLAEEAPGALKRKLAVHLAEFRKHHEIAEHLAAAQRKTNLAIERTRPGDDVRVTTECPACAQTAVIFGEVDYDWDGIDSIPQGVAIHALHCYFCDLNIDDYTEIDLLKLYEYVT